MPKRSSVDVMIGHRHAHRRENTNGSQAFFEDDRRGMTHQQRRPESSGFAVGSIRPRPSPRTAGKTMLRRGEDIRSNRRPKRTSPTPMSG
jgi:hypothetical protein